MSSLFFTRDCRILKVGSALGSILFAMDRRIMPRELKIVSETEIRIR